MDSRSKHGIKSRLTGKMSNILHKTILVKLNRNCVNEIYHLPYKESTKVHDELQDIHTLSTHALNCKLAVLCKYYCSKQRMKGFSAIVILSWESPCISI